MPVPGVRVHGGDHPVLRNPTRDPERPIGAGLQVLTQHRGQQRRRLLHRLGQFAAIQQREHREPVPGPRIDQLFAGGPVVPVDLRLAVADVVVPAAQHHPQLRGQVGVGGGGGGEQPAHRRPDQRDRVHRGHRVIQRRRVQHPAPAHQTGRMRRLQTHLEDPVRACRTTQPRAHVHQHRVREAAPPRAVATDPGRVTPPHIEGIPLDRLPVREPAEALQHHHRGHHRRRHRTPTRSLEQIIEQLIGEQPVPLPSQEPVDRVPRQRALAEPDHIVEQITLTVHPAHRHLIILSEPRTDPGDRHAKNTSHLGRG